MPETWKFITCDHCGDQILSEEKFVEHLDEEHDIQRGEI